MIHPQLWNGSKKKPEKVGQGTFCPATNCPRTYIVPGKNVALEVCYDGYSWVYKGIRFGRSVYSTLLSNSTWRLNTCCHLLIQEQATQENKI